MVDIGSYYVSEEEFSIEEKLVAAVWVHERMFNKKSMEDIQRDFVDRFRKRPPTNDLLLFWERYAFSCGSVNIVPAEPIPEMVSRSMPPPSYVDSYNGYSHMNSLNRKTSVGKSGGSGGNGGNPRTNPRLHKTQLCRQYYDTGECQFGEMCAFAHGNHELRQVQNYKTKPCSSYHSSGYCKYGAKCIFVHEEHEAMEHPPSAYLPPPPPIISNHTRPWKKLRQ